MKKILFIALLFVGCGDDQTEEYTPTPPRYDIYPDGYNTLPAVDPTAEQTECTVDFSEVIKEIDIKRGRTLDEAVYGDKDGEFSKAIAEDIKLGMELCMIARDLNQYTPAGQYADYFDVNKYSKSYRCIKGMFGNDGAVEEFQLQDDGSIVVTPNYQFVSLCKKMIAGGMRPVIQCSGAPVQGFDNGSIKQLFDLNTKYEHNRNARYYPLPVESEYERYAEVYAEFMTKTATACGNKDMIFCGNQEPTHTTGYTNGWKKGSNSTDAARNTKEYPKVWSGIAKNIHKQGLYSGCSQLNQEQGAYLNSIQAIYNSGEPTDFFTIQNYRGRSNYNNIDSNGNIENNGEGAGVIPTAVKGLNMEKYGEFFDNTKILFNRYCTDRVTNYSANEMFQESKHLIAFLQAEQVIFDYSERFYGYCFYDIVRGYKKMDLLFKTLNSASHSARALTGLPKGVEGFAFGDENSATVFVWNTSSTKTMNPIKIDLSSSEATYNLASISSIYNKTMVNEIPKRWDADAQSINHVILRPQEIYVIEATK